MLKIGLAGPMGAGKTTISQELQALLIERGHSVAIQPMAGPLKAVAKWLGWDGKKDARGRRLLQLLGTDVCRRCIDNEYWVKKWLEMLPDVDIVICDDVRFNNEAACLDYVFMLPMRFDDCKRWYHRWFKVFKYTIGWVHPSEKSLTAPTYDFPVNCHTPREFALYILMHLP